MPTLTRVARTSAATLDHVFLVGETATDSTTTVTVAVTDANGATVISGNATSAGAATGRYTFPLPGQALLGLLTVAWSATIAATAVTEQDQVEITGGFLFTLVEGRGSDESLTSTTKYPTAKLVEARLEVEQECEEICDRAFVPRYRRALLDGTGTSELVLPTSDVRSIRAVRMAPRAGGTFTAFTASELAALVATEAQVLRRVDSNVFTEGLANVIVEYEHGWDAPPADLKKAALQRLRSRLNLTRTNIPDRAASFVSSEGGTYRLTLPAKYQTGLPEVDAIYARYSRRASSEDGEGGTSGGPASRTLDFDPQYYSLYHGGRR
ncbi:MULTISPECIES: hypothetical protein [unclassified Crossiella]|uniref:hypothetical protein n=1 Tax=unclassified Crossiella TaxID=2620835 RepID=UPI001FFED045|nr:MULTISPECIES: hypothetical protein [unclassified Crossiella]MCK2242148.1 hypothetical protein [Crossiella sp. S99.2]MCK2256051.1 hypothetical protein [Crossiella sp. S99.1]